MQTVSVAATVGLALAANAAGQLCTPQAWAQRSSFPPPRASYSAVFDTARQEMLVFGGSAVGNNRHADTWVWRNESGWTQLFPTNAPPGREDAAVAYDSVRGVTVLFGGFGTTTPLGDTWEWNGANWIQRTPLGSPQARAGAAMTFDESRGTCIMFGGTNGSLFFDTWEWLAETNTWVARPPLVAAPLPRVRHSLTYDAARGKHLLFGGVSGFDSRRFEDTWELSFTASGQSSWIQRLPPGRPLGRSSHGAAYDSDRQRVVIFGGQGNEGLTFNDTWEWDGSLGIWTQRAPSIIPSARAGVSLVYDRGSQRTVMFAGTGVNGLLGVDTLSWDTAAGEWEHLSPGPTPASRYDTAGVFDPAAGEMMMFGGHFFAGGHGNDTWLWNGERWLLRSVPGPGGRAGHAMAFDLARNRAVLFGGRGPNPLRDTWEWNGSGAGEWLLRSNTGPSPRQMAALAYDESRGSTVLFGGTNGSTSYSDTWEWDGEAWTQRFPALSPAARDTHAMAYDVQRGVIILYGGFPAGGGSWLRDTWEWEGSTGSWTQRSTMSAIPLRASFQLVYHDRLQAVVLFGGIDGSQSFVNDLWRWEPGSASWQLVNLQRLPPPSQRGASVFDSVRGSLVMFGGNGIGGHLGTTWELPCVCYANCDSSSATPVLNVADFTCFLQRFAAGENYANCDGSTQTPVLNVSDFTCFLQAFAQGCAP